MKISWLKLLIWLLLSPLLYSYWLMPNAAYYTVNLPTQTKFMKFFLKESRDKKTQQPMYLFIPLAEISPYLIKAVIFAEDGGFYYHQGIDWNAIYLSFKDNFARGKIVRGGSTITMQLSKNLFLYPKKSFFRKAVELCLAWRLDRQLSKDRIIELYLNLIEWAPGVYGAERGAQYYFNKSARELDEQESALMAAIIMAPKSYQRGRVNPFFVKKANWVLYYLLTGEIAVSENLDESIAIVEELYFPLLVTFNILEKLTIAEIASTQNSLFFASTENYQAEPTASLITKDEVPLFLPDKGLDLSADL